MAKTTYKNLITVPDSATDNIVSAPNTGVGGDLVANFKAIADVINPSGTTGCQALNVGCNFRAGAANSPAGAQYHILNNNGHNISSWVGGAFGSGDLDYGVQSGAFMKGVLLDLQGGEFPSGGYKLLDVPYCGGMIIQMQILIIDCTQQVHAVTGTITVYPMGIYGTGDGLVQGSGVVNLNPDGDRVFGTFEVSNGDLYFKTNNIYDAVLIQIGMHGTILVGTFDDINSAQTSSAFMPYYSA